MILRVFASLWYEPLYFVPANARRISSFNKTLVLTTLMAMALTQFLALILGQILVLAPAFTQCFALLRRQFPNALIAFARFLALFRRELHPLPHARLQSLLTFGGHVRVAPRDFQPALATLRRELIPFLLEWCQNLALLDAELRPIRRRLCKGSRWRGQQQERAGYCCCSCEVCESHASNPGSV